MSDSLIPIQRKEGVTLYGRIVGKGGKLGQYEVHSDMLGFDGKIYTRYAEAEVRFSAIVGHKSGNNKQEKNDRLN